MTFILAFIEADTSSTGVYSLILETMVGRKEDM